MSDDRFSSESTVFKKPDPKPYAIEFELIGLPGMTNPSSGASRRNFWAKNREANTWKARVFGAVVNKRPKEPLMRAKLTLTRFSSMAPDPDGLVSGFKHIVDGLVKSKVIVNDKLVNIGMPDYRWEQCKPGEGRVRIKVEEISK